MLRSKDDGSKKPIRRIMSGRGSLVGMGKGSVAKDAVSASVGQSHNSREALSAWHRHDVGVTDVYEVVDLLGEGHMGEVYKVQRKVEDRGMHNSATRAKFTRSGSSSFGDMEAPSSPRRTKAKSLLKKIKKKKKEKTAQDRHLCEMRLAVEEVNNSLPKEPLPSGVPASPKSILRNSTLKPSSSVPVMPSLPLSTLSAPKPPNTPPPRNRQPAFQHQQSLDDSISSIFCDSSSSVSSSNHSVEDTQTHPLPELNTAEVATPAKRRIRFRRLYACKTVSTPRIKTDQMDALMNEIYIMRTLDHPYILPLYEVYQVKRKIWLITELCTGGDLTSRKLTEPEAAVVLEQVLYAVAYMHNRNICHRDIKLENIMYETTRKDASIRLIDFGLSQTFDGATVKRDFVRSAYTLSPEMAAAGKQLQYTAKTDMWCIGIVAWILLAGDPPFFKDGADLKDKATLEKLINAKYTFGITWKGRGVTDHAKNFVKGLLKKNPNDRWTAKEALDFLRKTWIPALEEKTEKEKQEKDSDMKLYLEMKEKRAQERRDLEERARKFRNETEGVEEEEEEPVKVEEKKSNYDGPIAKKRSSMLHRSIHNQRKESGSLEVTIDDLNRFCGYGIMKKTALLTMAHTMDRGDVGKLRDIFMMADIEDTGTINLFELKAAFKSFNLDADADDATVERIFKGIDHDKSGQIHYAEFLAALVEGHGLITMERLADAFDRIDIGGKGYISHDDLKELLGRDYNHAVVDKMIQEADFKKNGQVDYEEFLQLMFEDVENGLNILGEDGVCKLRKFSEVDTSDLWS